jgi:F-type H+-transporting ATPase subunit b
MLARSQEDIEARRREMMRFARAEVEEAQAKWFDALVRERQAIVRDLRERVGERVLAVARRALKELAGVELKREAPTIFLERLRSLPLA